MENDTINRFCMAGVIIKTPLIKPTPKIGIEIQEAIDTQSLEEAHIYVHCYYDNPDHATLIRIWNTTFLVDTTSGARAGLLHAENISIAPQWTLIADYTTFHFLLIFPSLPQSCEQFDFVEDIQEPDSFLVKNIKRNNEDVYHITIV